MNLKTCHIINFGNLTNKDYTFDEKITALMRDNGAGKSTLADFIKIMLYGMETIKANDTSFKEREHYYPFNGQTFGGTLILEHLGKIYRIERTFDVKSATKDKKTIYVDDVETTFGKEIGEELLGLNKESFEKLLFINASDIKIEANSNIKQKLNSLIASTSETDKLNIKSLTSSITEATKNINAIQKDINEYKMEIERKTNLKASLPNKYQMVGKINKEYDDLHNKQKAYMEGAALKERWQNYDEKQAKITNLTNELNNLNKQFPLGMPSDTELATLSEKLSERTTLISVDHATEFSKEKTDELNALKKLFTKGGPNSEEMEQLKVVDQAIKENQQIIQNQMLSSDKKVQLTKYQNKFADGKVNEAYLNNLDQKIREYQGLEIQLQNTCLSTEEKEIKARCLDKNIDSDEATLKELMSDYEKHDQSNKTSTSMSVLPTKRHHKKYIILLALALVMIALGIGLIFIQKIVGSITISIGAITLIVDGFLYLNNKIQQNFSSNHVKDVAIDNELFNKITQIFASYSISLSTNIYAEYESWQTLIKNYRDIEKKDLNYQQKDTSYQTLGNEIKAALDDYVVYDNFIEGINQLRNDFVNYEKLSQDANEIEEKIKQAQDKLDQLKQEYQNVFVKYQIDSNQFIDYYAFKEKYEKYESLNNEMHSYENKKQKLQESLKQVENAIKEIDDKYQLGLIDHTNTLDEIKTSCQEKQRLNNDIKLRTQEIQNYQTTNKLINRPDFDKLIDYSDDLKIKLEELTRKQNEIKEIEKQMDELEIDLAKLNELNDQLATYNHQKYILESVKKEFEIAQINLDKKYLDPINNEFNKYKAIIDKTIGYETTIKRDFNVELEVNGQAKSDMYLSAGQKSILALCYRLAMLDNIYKDLPIFIVMDDPFMMLDQNNLDIVRNMINDIIAEKQIIYFSCHESRKIA